MGDSENKSYFKLNDCIQVFNYLNKHYCFDKIQKSKTCASTKGRMFLLKCFTNLKRERTKKDKSRNLLFNNEVMF